MTTIFNTLLAKRNRIQSIKTWGKWLFFPIKNGVFKASLPHIEEYFGCGNNLCKGCITRGKLET